MNENNKKSEAEILHEKAEDMLKTTTLAGTASTLSLAEVDPLKLIHELQVHQVELEMQKEELRHAWAVGQIAVDKFTELYEFAPTGYLSLSKEGRIIEINFSASQMLGKERLRLKSSSFCFFVSDDTKPVFNLFFETVFSNKTKETCELTLTMNGNSPVYVQLNGILTEKGDHCLVSIVDITTRRRMENMNLARLNLLKFAENHNLDDFLEETLNQAEQLTGSMIGFYHFIAADQKTILLQNWSTRTKKEFCNAEGKGMHYNVSRAGVWADCIIERRPVIHNDYLSLPHRKGMPPGHALVIRELTVPVFRHGKIMAMLGIGNKPAEYTDSDVELVSLLTDLVWDIVERKRAEESLQNTLSLIDSTLDSIHNAILVVDHHGKVLKTNAKFAEIWHIPVEVIASADDKELLNAVLDQLVAPDDFMTRVSELYGKPEAESIDLIYLSDGRIFERISKPMFIRGKPGARVWSFLDITERAMALQQLKVANDDLQNLNAEKDKFFSIIAHDLRSPFNTFLGFTKMMAEDLDSFSSNDLQKVALSMRNSATNLYSLLEKLLEWSRIRRGATVFEPVFSPLMPIIEESLITVREPASHKKIEIGFEINGDCKVFADRYMLSTIVRNLVTNAIKFSHGGGKISIVAKPMTGSSVEISIRDTGIGMNKSMVDNLFRLDKQTNRKGTEGELTTGLGLMICKEFVEKHGGNLWVVSEEGKGSTFYFSLPAEGVTHDNIR